ncbi:MAG: AMP-binding protein [Candidatus Omnitrophota bacterium]
MNKKMQGDSSFFLLHERFIAVAARYPHKTALQIRVGEREYEKCSYERAAVLTRAMGAYLIDRGIRSHDMVALVLENRPEWAIAYFGILLAGATAVPIDPQLTAQEIENLITDSGAKITFTKANIDEIFAQLKEAPQERVFPVVDLEDPASLIYTSGTTALPKGVILTHKNFSANCRSLDSLGIFNANDGVISILPLHHSYAFMITLLLPLSVGASVTYIRALRPEEIRAAMQEASITVLVGVPQLFYLFHKGIMERIAKLPWFVRALKPLVAAKIRRAFGSRLRFFVSGGARLDPGVAGDLARLGFTVLEGYGLTETAPVVAFNRPARQKFGSVGLPVPGVEVRIAAPDAHGAGVVQIRGANVMKGYFRRPEETAEVIREGWFDSGDIGYLDQEGYLFLTGRQKEIIVLSNGKNIYPDEIEAHYRASGCIQEICVTGFLKNGVTAGLGAVIVPNMEFFKKTGEVNIHDKVKWELENLSKGLPAYKRVISYCISKEELPKTRLGKIKRYEVERRFSADLASARSGADPASGAQDVPVADTKTGRRVAAALTETLRLEKPPRCDDHLELDLGIDSLGRVELIAAIEKSMNITIAGEDMADVFTVRELIARLEILAARPRQGSVVRAAGEASPWKAILQDEPPALIKDRIELTPGFISVIFTYAWWVVLRGIFGLFFRLRVTGKENIPAQGPYILCPNHTSWLDAFIVAASVPPACALQLFFLGYKVYFFQPVIRNMIRLMRVVPIDPAVELMNALRASAFIVRNKRSLCIFPEGQRSIDGDVVDFKKGVGILAKELEIDLIPVYLEGAFEAWPRNQLFPKIHPLTVTFGKPQKSRDLIRRGIAAGKKDDYEAIVCQLKEEVLKLKKS